MDARIKLGLKSNQSLVVQPLCRGVKKANAKAVDDGIRMLMEALKLRPDYDDAMAYMNLLYRERADIQCGDPQAAAADTRTAERWLDLTMSVKKSKSRLHEIPR